MIDVFSFLSLNITHIYSKLKIDLKADKIKLGQCVTINEESFNQEILDDGYIYFLNTQKLGKKF